MALLPGEPAGMISTRTAGIVDLHASFTWRTPDHSPPDSILDALPRRESGTLRCALSESEDSTEAKRHVFGEIRGLWDEELSDALDGILRAAHEHATLSEAIMEVSAIRRFRPAACCSRLRERMARDLRDAGFPVRSGPWWTPAVGADIALGSCGARGELAKFLRKHGFWRLVSGA